MDTECCKDAQVAERERERERTAGIMLKPGQMHGQICTKKKKKNKIPFVSMTQSSSIKYINSKTDCECISWHLPTRNNSCYEIHTSQ